MATTAERIQTLRKEFNMNQDELAAALKVSKDTISSWERGIRCPTGERLSNLARFFYVTEDYLNCKSDNRLIDNKIVRDIPQIDLAPVCDALTEIDGMLKRASKSVLKEVYSLLKSLEYEELEDENSSEND